MFAAACVSGIQSVRMMSRKLFLAAIIAAGAVVRVDAADWRWESVGLRYGISASSFNSILQQSEAFGRLDLPWHWDFAEHWRLQTRLDASVGWLGGRGDSGVVGALGPSLAIKHEHFPIEFEAGSSPTLLSRDRFGNTDFGIPFQFTSFLGLSADIGKRWGAGYRFQHMSNAGLGSDNPGLNMQMFSVRYRF